MNTKRLAAYQKSPMFTRDSFLKTPDWRWQLARSILNARMQHMSSKLPSDAKVLFAMRLQKAFKDPKKRQFILHKMKNTYLVCILGTTELNAPLRCLLLACLINLLTTSSIVLKLKWIKPSQVLLYKDLFFDIQGISGLPGWFLQFLLLPIKGLKNGALFRTRALAYYYSLLAALHSLRFGKTGKTAKLALALMWRDLRNKKIFDYVAKNLNVSNLVYTTIMLQTIQAVENRDFTLKLKGLSSLSMSIMLYANAILKGVRGFTQDLINNINMLSVDAANKYLANILALNKG